MIHRRGVSGTNNTFALLGWAMIPMFITPRNRENLEKFLQIIWQMDDQTLYKQVGRPN